DRRARRRPRPRPPAAGAAEQLLRPRAPRPLPRLPGARRRSVGARGRRRRRAARHPRDACEAERPPVSARTRLSLFLVAGSGLAALLGCGVAGLPAFGDYHGPYGL